MLFGAALAVGLLAGAGVWAFRWLIGATHHLVFGEIVGERLSGLGIWTVALAPVIGGLVVGLLMQYLVGPERHHGVAGIMEAVALAGGRLRYKRMPAKAAAAAISLGSGAAVGPEDPSVQIGSSLGSMFGQVLRLSDERMRSLVAAGAAGGIAAAFNAPIAGVFFALEIVLGEIAGSAFGVVVLASVVSAVFTQAVAGAQPAFLVPAYAFHAWHELPLYFGLGLIAGPVAAAYVRLLYKFQDLFGALKLPRWTKPALAGAIVGAVGIFLPQVFGEGYETIEGILTGERLGIVLLLAILAAKLVLTPVSIGGGFPGGVFAPALFLGAVLGAAYGEAAVRLLPGVDIAPAAFAMVGMAALLAGAVHAPLTAILLLFELTNDYRIILPLMFAVIVSLLVSQRLQKDSVYSLGLARKGIRIERGRDVEVLEGLTVEEVMEKSPPTLRESESLASANDKFLRLRYHGLPVLDDRGALAGMLTVQDIDRARLNNGAASVGEACTRELLTTHPDETLGQALRKMSVRDVGRLPVVPSGDPGRLLGVLRRTDVIRAYTAALTRRAALRHSAQQVRLGAVTGVSIQEILVEAGAPCDGKPLREISWPADSVIASLRREDRMMIPKGDTVLCAGDVLAVVSEEEARPAIRRICQRG